MIRFATVVLGVALAFALTGGAIARAQSAPRTPIVVAPIASTDQVAVWYAQQQGWWEKAGLDVTIQQVPSGGAALTAVLGGAAQFGYANPLSLIEAHAKGAPLLAVAPGVLYRPLLPHAALLVAGDSTLKPPKDLIGKTIAVAGLHDLLGMSITYWLHQNGIDPSTVKFVEMPPAAMTAALDAKRVDAIGAYEPFLGAALVDGAKIFAKPYDAIGPNFEAGVWFGNAAWLNTHRDAALAFNRVIEQADQYVNLHYDDLMPLIAQVTKLTPDTLRVMVHLYTPPSLRAPLFQPVIDAAAKEHEIAAPFNATDMFFPGIP
jgi:NitT/TauT family transport system substrate-binding protein